MSIARGPSLFLIALPALSHASSALQGKPAAPTTADGPEVAEHGTPALFSWADFDGDTRLDLAAVGPDGRIQLLANASEGRFEEVTERVGLAGIENAALALWADYDNDGRLDLFVGAREGGSRLLRNEGGVFTDMSAGSGLQVEGAVQSAHWLDHDGDGLLDLHVVTADQNGLFRGLEGGFFELSELPLAERTPGLGASSDTERFPAAGEDTDELGTPSAPGSPDDLNDGKRAGGTRTGTVSLDDLNVSGSRVSLSPTPGGVTPLGPFPLACASSIRNQANPGSCLQASTTPALGRLYPISSNLFVAVGGNVGIGTTSPTARLEVAGTARMTDTLTLAPSGDTALDVSTGSIYKGGALFIHTKGGLNNTSLGRSALANVTTGSYDTACGDQALNSNTTGHGNTASGAYALFSNTSGSGNTASGAHALRSNTTGYRNTASGSQALFLNTTGSRNTASGTYALLSNTTGIRNTASGAYALFSNTTGYRNTASGADALRSNTTGFRNTASGAYALFSNTNGSRNTASGTDALLSNTTGGYNTASGTDALRDNTTGSVNTASGYSALRSNTTGIRNTASGADALFSNTNGNRNTAIGDLALYRNTTGSRNVALGYAAGFSTTGNYNIAIGTYGVAGESSTMRIGTAGMHTRAFIVGIRGVTTGNANAIPVLVDSAGQLGTVSSSRRFKEEIADMGEMTERLLELRPVVFRYKPEVQQGERPLEYGLIAEEVAEVFPELVVYDEEGMPFTVKYHLLSSMLLNELKEQAHEVEELHERLDECSSDHERELAELRKLLTEIDERTRPGSSAALTAAAR